MTENWMVNVLADLQKFAKDNRMGHLVAQLDDTIHIAAIEMAPDDDTISIVKHCPDDKPEYPQPAFVV
ncbi:MAG: hypothetical protein IME92_04540 [Proteobacteria bacterium]|nr:hypothetical protein [Pseudomonadota bacterium]